jgi:hypothetical protein
MFSSSVDEGKKDCSAPKWLIESIFKQTKSISSESLYKSIVDQSW